MPIATTFENRWLSTSVPLTSIGLLHEPATLALIAPFDPTLAGLTLSFQALSRSTSSAIGATWTSLVQVTLE
jgi:hypothetical protein